MKVAFNKIYDNLIDSDFAFEYMEDMTISSFTNKSYLSLRRDYLDHETWEKISCFLELIGIKEEDHPNNFGTATFTDLQLERACLGYIGLEFLNGKDQDPEPVLKIGNDVGDGERAINIRIESTIVESKVGRKKTSKQVYIIGDVELEIERIYEKDNPSKLIANYGKIHDAENDIEYIIPFLVDKEYCPEPVDFYEAFKKNELHSALKIFGTGGGRNWAEANKLFRGLFSPKNAQVTYNGWSEKHYENGIAFIVKNARSKFIPEGSFDGAFSSDYFSCDWEIVASTHPDALVRIYNKKDFQTYTLDQITNINFTSSAKKTNEGYHGVIPRKISNADGFYPGLGLIVFTRPHPINPDWIPQNTLTLIDINNPKSIKKVDYYLTKVLGTSNAVLKQELMDTISNSINDIKSVESLQEVSDDDARSSLHQNSGWYNPENIGKFDGDDMPIGTATLTTSTGVTDEDIKAF